ncbi:hypothetical protein KDW54_06890 [Burkholderia ambifaria]|uniref:hypothetical protein n=1 Tax=Burkholderia ambifaria TaxID=152480 RepID=UPI001B943A7B|nr:hypothetical protein [Burkholderia ambifaria]MBR8182122.1 hypothetical protein [Burkholderia ambifaria]
MPKWTEEDLATLRRIWDMPVRLQEIQHLLPTHSVDAIRAQALYIGLPHRVALKRPWSAEEMDIVRDIYSKPGSVKAQLHRLPGRSWRAVLDQACRMGMEARDPKDYAKGYAWVDDEIERVLKDGVTLSAKHISERCSAAYQSILERLRKGRGTLYHVARWNRNRATGTGSFEAIWTLGAGEDAPKPYTSNHERHLRYKRKKKEGLAMGNPWLAVAGLVKAPETKVKGRVFKQDMVIHTHDELEEA